VLNPKPSEAEISAVQERLGQLEVGRLKDLSESQGPALTSDGHRVEVVANVRHAEDITKALAHGAEGVGLLRSEFLFEGRTEAPGEEDHLQACQAAARALGRERPLVIRTLDVGGDKSPSYLPLPHEENPFLGVRGIRVSLEHPELFRAQLRGLLRAAPECNLHIMFPMVSTVAEFRQARAIAEQEMLATGQRAKIGVMIEVPSAALMADTLAKEADFFSIGTNDLTQYVLAMDRGHARLAKVADTLEPAVLRMIAMTVEAAHRHGKWVGVCGGAASDPKALPLLLGLGVDELSVSPVAIPAIKAQIRGLSLAQCRSLAESALGLATAAEVRALCGVLYPKH
jgi:phosphocarrier protein FPr/phosphocarrier protein